MSSTLCVRKTPIVRGEWTFKLPFKGYIAREFYGHDGTLGGGEITIGPDRLDWLRGVRLAGNFDDEDLKQIDEIIQHIAEGGSVNVWFRT